MFDTKPQSPLEIACINLQQTIMGAIYPEVNAAQLEGSAGSPVLFGELAPLRQLLPDQQRLLQANDKLKAAEALIDTNFYTAPSHEKILTTVEDAKWIAYYHFLKGVYYGYNASIGGSVDMGDVYNNSDLFSMLKTITSKFVKKEYLGDQLRKKRNSALQQSRRALSVYTRNLADSPEGLQSLGYSLGIRLYEDAWARQGISSVLSIIFGYYTRKKV